MLSIVTALALVVVDILGEPFLSLTDSSSYEELVEGFYLIDKFLHFIMYNAINDGVSVTFCSGCWLITEVIFFFLGHEWDYIWFSRQVLSVSLKSPDACKLS